MMSGENTPILSGAIPAFEMFMTKWEWVAGKHARLKSIVQAGLESAYKYYNRMDHMKAYVVAMCKQIYFLIWPKLTFPCSDKPCVAHELDQGSLGKEVR
jgi:hypothetical protein